MSTFVDVPEIKLIRTDTTLDLSQKAEKVCFFGWIWADLIPCGCPRLAYGSRFFRGSKFSPGKEPVDPVKKFVFKNFTKSKNAARIWPNLSTLKAKNKAVVPESNRERARKFAQVKKPAQTLGLTVPPKKKKKRSKSRCHGRISRYRCTRQL